MTNEINMLMPLAPPVTDLKKGSRQPEPLKGQQPGSLKGQQLSFQEAVRRELTDKQGVKLSAHAEKRLQERNITLAPKDLERISEAVQQAASKGARESLIIYEGLALITSIRQKTIVTAMDSAASASHVFTNIDSAVLIGGSA